MSRKRTIKKSFWVNEDEDDRLKKYVKETSKNESELFREFINGSSIKEKPQDDFYEAIKEFRMLSRSLSRVILLADEETDLDIPYIKNEIEKIDKFILDIKIKFLL